MRNNEDIIRSRRKVKFKNNPFVPEVEAISGDVRRTLTGSEMALVNRNTGEEVRDAGFWCSDTFDKTPFIKVYQGGYESIRLLTKPGLRILEMVCKEVQFNKANDVVFLSFSAVDQKTNPVTRDVFSKGIRNLIDNEFIARTFMTSRYYLNPAKLWNGNRNRFLGPSSSNIKKGIK